MFRKGNVVGFVVPTNRRVAMAVCASLGTSSPTKRHFKMYPTARLNRNWVHSPPLVASYILRFIKPRSAKRLVAVMPRRGLSAVDGVEGLPRGGKQRAQIFTQFGVR
jgi:hypothetical protein